MTANAQPQPSIDSARPFREIPRAPRLPLIGAMPELLWRRYGFFTRAREQCGDLFVVDLGLEDLVIVADPALAEDVLVRRSQAFDKGGNFWDQSREAVGNGLTFSEGEVWRRQRRRMNPEFRRAKIMGFRATIRATVDELLVELEREVAQAGQLDISVWTAKLLATLTVRLLFGGELDAATFERLHQALGDLLAGVLVGVVTRTLPAWVPVPGAARFEAAIATIDEIVLALIAERRASPRDGNDVLSLLLSVTDEDGAMTDRELVDEVVVLYSAGYETTAWALAWTTMALAEQPELVRELQAELDRGDDPLALPLLDATFREGLRLYPSAPFVPRRAVCDETLGGYRIPAGTQVVVMSWLIHRDPRHWPNPTRFDPRRHLEPSERPRMAWMPFGGGQRLCLGMGLAMMEGTMALAQLLRRFTPLPASRRSEPRLSVTLASRDGVWVRLAPR